MKKEIIKVIILFVVTIGMSGCGISPYRKEAGFMFTTFGGYYDFRLENGTYDIEYQSGHTLFRNEEKVRDFALRRACELAIEKGAYGFLICGEGGTATGWGFEIQLTNLKGENVLDAKKTLTSLQIKYK